VTYHMTVVNNDMKRWLDDERYKENIDYETLSGF